MNTDPINEAGLRLIMRNEGCRLHAYTDIVGVWTIGYGHTGPEVRGGLTWTQEQCDAALSADLDIFEQGVDEAIDDAANTTDNQFAAMVSLAYNIGLGHFKSSTLVKRHVAGDPDGAADAFLMWNKAGGQVVAGLSRRREEERELYLTPDPMPTKHILGTPPIPMDRQTRPTFIAWLKGELGL